MGRRRAFTVIEFLAVLGVIAILLSLLLPSIHLARQRARTIQCTNNLKQIGMALLNYATTYETLPPGSMNPLAAFENSREGDPVSWTVQILPYLEQNYIARSWDDQSGPHAPSNRTFLNVQVNTFMCPGAERVFADPATRGWGPSTYAGCHHDVEAPIGESNHGVLYRNSSVRATDIGDGVSQTIFVGEVPLPSAPGWASGTRSTLRNTGHPINGVDLNLPGVLALPKKVPIEGPLSLLELEKRIHEGSASIPDTFVGGFGSNHAEGGANFAFGDGSVRFLHTTIDLQVYRRLGNRDDGEVIDDETAY